MRKHEETTVSVHNYGFRNRYKFFFDPHGMVNLSYARIHHLKNNIYISTIEIKINDPGLIQCHDHTMICLWQRKEMLPVASSFENKNSKLTVSTVWLVYGRYRVAA